MSPSNSSHDPDCLDVASIHARLLQIEPGGDRAQPDACGSMCAATDRIPKSGNSIVGGQTQHADDSLRLRACHLTDRRVFRRADAHGYARSSPDACKRSGHGEHKVHNLRHQATKCDKPPRRRLTPRAVRADLKFRRNQSLVSFFNGGSSHSVATVTMVSMTATS